MADTLSGTVTAQTGFAHLSDLPCWQLRLGDASAVISSFGAQVLSYQPEPGKELLWLSPVTNWHQQPIRGGIPICWPWFGPADPTIIPVASSLPNHGLVRTLLWQLQSMEQNDSFSSLTLQVTLDKLPHFTSPVTLHLKLTLSSSLTVELRCDSPIPQQAALHSYFAVSTGSDTEVSGLSQHYVDKVNNSNQQQEHDRARISAETDRLYQNPSSLMTINSPDASLQIAQTGQDHAVVWNPWKEKSKAISDMPAQGYLDFVCVETARLSWQPMPLLVKQQISLL